MQVFRSPCVHDLKFMIRANLVKFEKFCIHCHLVRLYVCIHSITLLVMLALAREIIVLESAAFNCKRPWEEAILLVRHLVSTKCEKSLLGNPWRGIGENDS